MNDPITIRFNKFYKRFGFKPKFEKQIRFAKFMHDTGGWTYSLIWIFFEISINTNN